MRRSASDICGWGFTTIHRTFPAKGDSDSIRIVARIRSLNPKSGMGFAYSIRARRR